MDAAELHRLAADTMRSRGLLPAFAPPVMQEARAREAAGPEHRGDIRDLRRLAWFSIDNDDTRDLDQLTWAEPLANGSARLCVAVADVDAMVRAGGAIDGHAAANTTSVYTAAGVFPMLPELLSTDLTSLHEGEQRLAVVVEMEVAADGTVAAATLYRAAVVNHAKLTYRGVAAWLEGTSSVLPERAGGVASVQAQLRLHDTLAQRMQAWRHRRGALNLGTSQARPVFDGGGRLIDLRADERNRANDLIADVMIAANSATARFLVERKVPSLRRFLQSPRRWDRIVALAAPHGVTLPRAPDALALDRFLALRRAADPAHFAELSLAVVKLLGSGDYAAEAPASTGTAASVGHFGLAVNDYAHSTAPNRRYPDLVTQRLVKATLAGEAAPYTLAALTQIARHCTVQEDNANKVERQVQKLAAAYLLQGRLGEVFSGLVTGTPAKGTFARITSPMVEGRVVRGGAGLDVGDSVRLRLLAVDPAQGHIDFEPA